MAKNIIFGQLMVDFNGTIKSRNFKTGETAEITFYEAKGNTNSFLTGKGYDKNGFLTHEIEGSWLNELRLINKKTGVSRVIFKEIDLLPDAHLQYFYNPVSVLMNFKSDEMEGVVAPTDSRFRQDLRSFEEGRIDESELNKNLIEEE